MNNQERINNLKEDDYQEVFGVQKFLFDKMLDILQKKFDEEHMRGGHPPKLSVLDKLVIMLSYFREYRTMKHIAFDYSVSKSTICESIHWVEKTLIRSKQFKLPSKRKFIENLKCETIIIDVTECSIERPKKTAALLFRQKKETYYKNTSCYKCFNERYYI